MLARVRTGAFALTRLNITRNTVIRIASILTVTIIVTLLAVGTSGLTLVRLHITRKAPAVLTAVLTLTIVATLTTGATGFAVACSFIQNLAL